MSRSSAQAIKPHGQPCLVIWDDQSGSCLRQGKQSTLFIKICFEVQASLSVLRAHPSPSFPSQVCVHPRRAGRQGHVAWPPRLPNSGIGLPRMPGPLLRVWVEARKMGCGEWRTAGRLGGENRFPFLGRRVASTGSGGGGVVQEGRVSYQLLWFVHLKQRHEDSVGLFGFFFVLLFPANRRKMCHLK